MRRTLIAMRQASRHSRAFTLVELLMALALFAALAIATSAWAVQVAGLDRAQSARLNADGALEAACALLQEDVRSASAECPSGEPCVRFDDSGSLWIRVRQPAEGVHGATYTLSDGLLQRATTKGHPRPLVGGIQSWEARLDERGRWLTVTITRASEPEPRTLTLRVSQGDRR